MLAGQALSWHHASSTSSLLLCLDSVALGYVKTAPFILSGFSSCILKYLAGKGQISQKTKRIETFHFRKSLDPSGMDDIPKRWCGVSAPCFPFILMQVLLVFLMQRGSGLDQERACVHPQEKQSSLLFVVRNNVVCPEEVALKRVK